MSRGMFGWIVCVLICAVGCAAQVGDPDPGDGGQTTITHDPCSGNQQRCQGQSYQVCQANFFQEQQRCADGDVCDSTWGCLSANGCGSGADLIYTVDATGIIRSFNPSIGQFREVGKPTCPGAFGQINSMSVDRHAQAWVSTSLAAVYLIDLSTLVCKQTPVAPSASGYGLYGMGFATDGNGSTQESLYIAGGGATTKTSGRLGRIATDLFQVSTVGPLPDLKVYPELTGTGAGDLFGYYPLSSGAKVAQIDKMTARYLRQWALPPLSGPVTAWAFAHWGGKLYIFVTAGNNSQVQLFDPQTGLTSGVMSELPFEVVGAGVSTCAPLVIG